MIQRIQSVYLFLMSACAIVCMCLPIGRFVNDGKLLAEWTNLSLTTADGIRNYESWALFVLLFFVAVVSFLNIFLFKRRMLQVRITIFAGFLLLGYCLVYGLFVYRFLGRFDGSQFIFSWATSLPVIAMILDYLAFRGIMKDEMLIRTLDRLR